MTTNQHGATAAQDRPNHDPASPHRLAIVPGDGIGPEVIEAALTVLGAAESAHGLRTERTMIAAGAEHYRETGELFPAAHAALAENDAILFGAMGHPSVPPGVLEREFILAMRQAFRQAVNVRPVRLYPGQTSPITDVTPERCDLVIIRENTEGAYVGGGSTVHAGTPDAVAVQESVNTHRGIARAVEYAFRLAEARRGKVTLCHKTNILVQAGRLWADTFDEVAARHPGVETDYVHVDAMCAHLPLTPERFDVVVTDNLFGDIITDLGAVVQGGLGTAASANLNLDQQAPSMFEAIHGSAPDIAGRGWANPIGAIISLAFCLSDLGEAEAAAAIESAAVAVLAELPATTGTGPSTSEVGQQVAARVADAEPLPGSITRALASARSLGPIG